ncbi:MAG: hypothetical protein QNK37_38130 [Acidobacteriota bacterium]|nr:hypothetical protein [Acidobacteriota bacterium]
MQKLDLDLFNDDEVTVNQEDIAGATAVNCPPRVCATSIFGGPTSCRTYTNCVLTDGYLDLGF